MNIVGKCGQDAWHPELHDAKIVAWPPLAFVWWGIAHIVLRTCTVPVSQSRHRHISGENHGPYFGIEVIRQYSVD
jgi:hypothetical protein